MHEEVAPAKVNLALRVLEQQADGYHLIDSVFVFTRFADIVSVCPGHDISLCTTGEQDSRLQEDAIEDNLVWRAAVLLQTFSGTKEGASLFLDKRIPVAAGLGGGSADAAATLRLLNRFWGLNWSMQRLAVLGEKLGADVPACVFSAPLHVQGKGEKLQSLALDTRLKKKNCLLLVNPCIPVATGQIFSLWRSDNRKNRPHLSVEDTWEMSLKGCNDLEKIVCHLVPEVSWLLAYLRERPGVVFARMSGSGATCFAFFKTEENAQEVQKDLQSKRPYWWIRQTELGAFTQQH